jgi:hypothetical protein
MTGGDVKEIIELPAEKADIWIDASSASITAGGKSREGQVLLKDTKNNLNIRLDARDAIIAAGGSMREGLLTLNDKTAAQTNVCLDAQDASIKAGGSMREGQLILTDKTTKNNNVWLDAQQSLIRAGGPNYAGQLWLYDTNNQPNIRLDAKDAIIAAGGSMREGLLTLNDKTGVNNNVVLDAQDASIRVGGSRGAGLLTLTDKSLNPVMRFGAQTANITAGGFGQAGWICLLGPDSVKRIGFSASDATIRVGDIGMAGAISVFDANGNQQVKIDGAAGDIWISNGCDCAEDFEVSASEEIEPGTVMVIDSSGTLRQSTVEYDKCVAGVVAGSGDLKPGLVLGRQPGKPGRLPISLVGRVYCRVDADKDPIEVGDLLTSSCTPGYAMKAADAARAFGAVIGKALQPLKSGRGLIPILVALQ